MLSFLRDWLDKFVCFVKTALVEVVNLLISGIGALWEAVVDLLPDMPGQPDLPSQIDQAIWLMNEITDVGWLVAYVVTFFVMFGTLLGVMVALRWIRAAE